MKKNIHLKKNDEFRYVYKNGKSYANKYLVMYIADNGKDENRIGISVSKKVGNSVVRHRITRLIREIYRLNNYKITKNKDIVVVARVNAKDADYSKLESAYLHLCKIHNIISENNVEQS